MLLTADAGDMLRKSIVYDKNTPDVFYCPVHKPTGFDKMIVKAKPLSRLCQFEGGPIPKDYKSDCYNDVDESEYACKEKYRIMVRTTFSFFFNTSIYTYIKFFSLNYLNFLWKKSASTVAEINWLYFYHFQSCQTLFIIPTTSIDSIIFNLLFHWN